MRFLISNVASNYLTFSVFSLFCIFINSVNKNLQTSSTCDKLNVRTY